jgi:hypothetical protein
MTRFLQYSVHNLSNIAEEFSMEINTGNTKIMAFRKRNQGEASYASISGFWNKFILGM